MGTYLTQTAGTITEASPVTTSTGAADAGKIPALGATGKLDSSMLPAGAVAASGTSVVVDVGSTPVRSTRITGITVPGLSAGQLLVAGVSAAMPGSLSSDELEMDPIVVHAKVTATDTVELILASLGAPITGQRRINLIAA